MLIGEVDIIEFYESLNGRIIQNAAKKWAGILNELKFELSDFTNFSKNWLKYRSTKPSLAEIIQWMENSKRFKNQNNKIENKEFKRCSMNICLGAGLIEMELPGNENYIPVLARCRCGENNSKLLRQIDELIYKGYKITDNFKLSLQILNTSLN